MEVDVPHERETDAPYKRKTDAASADDVCSKDERKRLRSVQQVLACAGHGNEREPANSSAVMAPGPQNLNPVPLTQWMPPTRCLPPAGGLMENPLSVKDQPAAELQGAMNRAVSRESVEGTVHFDPGSGPRRASFPTYDGTHVAVSPGTCAGQRGAGVACWKPASATRNTALRSENPELARQRAYR
jgi:hypothetical protein